MPNDSSQTERVQVHEPEARAWRTPALLAVVLLCAGAGLLWAAGRMTPPPAPPEVVPPSTPPAVPAAATAPTTAPAAASRPTAVAATAPASDRPGAVPATPAAPSGPAAPAPAPTPGVAPAPAPAATPAPTPGAKTPIIAVKGSAVTCFEPQGDDDQPAGQPCTNQQLRGRVLERRAEIESCLAAVPAAKRPARGTISLRARWSLGDPPAGGKLARVRALRDAPKDPAFLACVKSELSQMHVKAGVCPRCYAEMTVTISY